MAMQLGTGNKKQVYLVIVLFALIFVIGGVELYNTLSGPSTPVRPMAALANRGAAGSQDQEAQKVSFANIDPVLHFRELAESEDVNYKGTGRNIFSAESAPPPIPKALSNGREHGPSVALPPAPPQPPAIDLKYFGYTETADREPEAYFLHGEDVFMAKSGQIVDHRYKVDSVRPASVDVTDLGYNHTQTLTISTN
jgi:hypothetical protein